MCTEGEAPCLARPDDGGLCTAPIMLNFDLCGGPSFETAQYNYDTAAKLAVRFERLRSQGDTLAAATTLAEINTLAREAVSLEGESARARYVLGWTLAQQANISAGGPRDLPAPTPAPAAAPAPSGGGGPPRSDQTGGAPLFADADGRVISDADQTERRAALDSAIAEYRAALALDPRLAAAHNNLGNALARKGDADAAIASYRQAIALGDKGFDDHDV